MSPLLAGLSCQAACHFDRPKQSGEDPLTMAITNLSGKTAFITGGAGGIGLGMAEAFRDAGMSVVIADVSDDALASASAKLAVPDRVLALKLDVADRVA